MANLNVAVLGVPDYAKDLGKKGTTSDLTFYNLKRGETTVTFVEPNRYPERLSPLFYAISMAKKAILVVDAINPAFGEEVLMLHCLDIKDGIVVLRNFLSKEQVAPLIKGTAVEGYQFMDDDKNAIREMLLAQASALKESCDSQVGAMPVDHFFNVKGVGIVALGCVREGNLRKHDELMVIPGEKTAQVRSIQKHDSDFNCAGVGDRTGMALKGVELEDIDRGTVLTNDKTIKSISYLEAKAELVKYWPSPLKEGMVLHLGHWMQNVPARIAKATFGGDYHKPNLTLVLDKVLVHRPGDRGVLTYPEGGKLRVVGTIELP
jgi:selenocysteine-specific translation elongation factor